jgi:hypothetical protein
MKKAIRNRVSGKKKAPLPKRYSEVLVTDCENEPDAPKYEIVQTKAKAKSIIPITLLLTPVSN